MRMIDPREHLRDSGEGVGRERMNLPTNVTGNEIHSFPISVRNSGNKMTRVLRHADSSVSVKTRWE